MNMRGYRALIALVLALLACSACRSNGSATDANGFQARPTSIVQGAADDATRYLRDTMYWYRDRAQFDADGAAECATIRGSARRLSGIRVNPDESYVADALIFLSRMCDDFQRQAADAAAGVPAPAYDATVDGDAHHEDGASAAPATDWEARTFIAQGHHRDACQRLALYKRATGDQQVNFAAYCNLLCAAT
jgi:hypothetical protein